MRHLTWVVLLATAPGVQGQVTSRDSAGIRIVVATPSRAVALALTSLPIRTIADSSILGVDTRVVGAVQTSDGTVWLAEASRQRLWKLPAKGGKSSAYDWASVYSLHRVGVDSILVWDGVARRGRLLDHTGKQRESRAVRQPRDVTRANGTTGRPALILHGRLGDGTLLGSLRDTFRDARSSHVASDSVRVVMIDPNGALAIVDTVHWLERVMFRGSRTGMDAPLPFGRTGAIVATNEGYLHSDGADLQVTEMKKDGSPRRIIRLARPPSSVTPADVARFKAARLATIPTTQRADYAAGLEWLPWPAQKRGWVALHRDATGRIWARQWAADNEEATWDLFATNGRHLGLVRVPAGITVLDIGNDHLVGMIQGMRGKEVRVYGLTAAN